MPDALNVTFLASGQTTNLLSARFFWFCCPAFLVVPLLRGLAFTRVVFGLATPGGRVNIDSCDPVRPNLPDWNGERAVSCLNRVTWLSPLPLEEDDAQLFARFCTLRIRQLNSLDFSTVRPTSPLRYLPIVRNSESFS